jgi:predicted chitinase
MDTPFPVLRLRDGFSGQNTHLRPAIREYQQLADAVSELNVTVDGMYGNDSIAVTQVLQRRYGFHDDGVVRPALVRWLRHLKDHPEDRIEAPAGVTLAQLVQIVGDRNEAHARRHLDGLNSAMETYDISTPLRRAHFIAQVCHESGGLRWNEELASGAAYEGRRDLGNTEPGDGRRFKGRGLIQLTGRANYRQYTAHCRDLGEEMDFEAEPERVAEPPHAARVAGWYWDSRRINRLADDDDVVAVTKKINGGTNGLDDRKRYLARAREVLRA